MMNWNCCNRPALLLGVFALSVLVAGSASATCRTRSPQTVAYQPVAYHTVAYQPAACQPMATTTYMPVVTQPARSGWYLGRWFDQMRMRRWARRSDSLPTYASTTYASGGVAPVYSVSYTPTVASSSCGTPACTTTYRPYLTSYAPMACQSLYRPVALSPAISNCSAGGCDPCGGYSTGSYSGGVGQAIYQVPPSSCSGCAPTSTGPIYSDIPQAGPATGQPQLPATPPASSAQPQSTYRPQSPQSSSSSGNSSEGAAGVEEGKESTQQADPTPQPEESGADQSTTLEAPRLLNPNDLTARRAGRNETGSNRPSVDNSGRPNFDVHTAVYHKPVTTSAASHSRQSEPTRAELDAAGWGPVSR